MITFDVQEISFNNFKSIFLLCQAVSLNPIFSFLYKAEEQGQVLGKGWGAKSPGVPGPDEPHQPGLVSAPYCKAHGAGKLWQPGPVWSAKHLLLMQQV